MRGLPWCWLMGRDEQHAAHEWRRLRGPRGNMLEAQGVQGRERSGEGRRTGKTKKEAGVRFPGGWGTLDQALWGHPWGDPEGKPSESQASRPLPTASRQFLNYARKKGDLPVERKTGFWRESPGVDLAG